MPVEEGAVDGCGSGDGGDADLGAINCGLGQHGEDPLPPAGRVGFPALAMPRFAWPAAWLGLRGLGDGHARALLAGDDAAGRTAGIPRLTARWLRMTATA